MIVFITATTAAGDLARGVHLLKGTTGRIVLASIVVVGVVVSISRLEPAIASRCAFSKRDPPKECRKTCDSWCKASHLLVWMATRVKNLYISLYFVPGGSDSNISAMNLCGTSSLMSLSSPCGLASHAGNALCHMPVMQEDEFNSTEHALFVHQ